MLRKPHHAGPFTLRIVEQLIEVLSSVHDRCVKMETSMTAELRRVAVPYRASGARVDTNVFDPDTALVASSTSDGMIHIFHENSSDRFSKVETVQNRVWSQDDGSRSENAQSLRRHFRF